MNLGIIAHNSKKVLIEDFCIAYKNILARHEVYATGTTGRRIEEVTNLHVHKFLAGSIGGDKQFMEMIEREDLDMVIGSRFINKEGFQSSALRRFGIIYFTGLIRLLTGKKITDPTSGLRMADRKVIGLFAADYPRDYPEPESVASIIRKGCKVDEIPVIMKARQGGVSSISPLKSIYYMIKVTLAIFIEMIRKEG